MSEGCTHNCETCNVSGCKDRTAQSLEVPANEFSNIKKVIAVVSGKGGVGKSMVTSLLSVLSRRKGYETAIIDADITGPSIPKTFKIDQKALVTDEAIFPVCTKTGIEMISINLLLEDETKPVIWRGPILAGTVKQFWSDVMWQDVDIMFVDCPPGTGDVPLTVFQSLPVDGIVVVTSPQDLVSMIVEKAVKMADMMNVPILGIVENMSYFVCDKCDEKHYIYGQSNIEELAKSYGIETIAKLPIEKKLRSLVDTGDIEDFDGQWLDELFEAIEKC
ncbi:MAG: Mrp/NBP35 family ATP-binding protein [Lachnospiraceae bacterium]|nr:Mrp/NBP35 family ATP-binding protein [Lachnospiraceae bacterium]